MTLEKLSQKSRPVWTLPNGCLGLLETLKNSRIRDRIYATVYVAPSSNSTRVRSPMRGLRAAHGYSDTTHDSTNQSFFDLTVNGTDAPLRALLGTIKHFFGGFCELFSGITDPRAARKVTYPLPTLAFTGVLMFLCHLGARRQIKLMLDTPASAATISVLFGMGTIPHGDTLNDAFRQCDPEEFQQAVCGLPQILIRKKVLYYSRVLDKFFVVAVDGTGTVTYSTRHCPHCLTQIQNGKTIYYHKVMEAKLVTPEGFTFSVMSEFIENPGENPDKQDCELKAFYRLAPRLKAAFPRLPILLTLDGLYACGPVFQICADHGWKFMIVLSDKDLPTVNQEFDGLSGLQPANRLSFYRGKQREIFQDFRWVDEIRYTDTQNREHMVHVIECIETKPGKQGCDLTSIWKWVTNLKVSKANVIALANDGGRRRWKIENQGFNAQKTGGYRLEHTYSTDPNAAKIFYYLLQIAHTIAQLLYNGSILGKSGRKALGAIKNLASRVLEAWRNIPFTSESLEKIMRPRLQIRLSPDTS
jgi:hypothetical protein